MATIGQENEPGVLVLLVTEQYEFFELFVVANATQGRTRFAAQTDTWVTTPQLQVARFVTRWSVARHPALPSASEVLATPATRFLTGTARVGTGFRATAVLTAILARLLARWADAGTVHVAAVTTDQCAAARKFAALVDASVETAPAIAFTGVLARQDRSASTLAVQHQGRCLPLFPRQLSYNL